MDTSRGPRFALLLLFQLLIGLRSAHAQDLVHRHTTLVLFADRPLNDSQSASLIAAMRNGLASGEAEMKALDLAPDIVRGDRIGPGLRVESPISVYLHGDCTLRPGPRRTAYGAPLGWVFRVDGRIEPFAHVDCGQIANVLSAQASCLDARQRQAAMAAAIARVVLHEWIHIATQRSTHSQSGIEKAQFGPRDLLGAASEMGLDTQPKRSSRASGR